MELAEPYLESKLILDAHTKKEVFMGLNNEKKSFFGQTALKIMMKSNLNSTGISQEWRFHFNFRPFPRESGKAIFFSPNNSMLTFRP